MDLGCQWMKQWSKNHHLLSGNESPWEEPGGSGLSQCRAMRWAPAKTTVRKSPVGSSIPTMHSSTWHGRGSVQRGAGFPGNAGSGRDALTVGRDVWQPFHLSHSLAVIPSTPRFKTFQIVVKAMSRSPPRREGRVMLSELGWSPKCDQWPQGLCKHHWRILTRLSQRTRRYNPGPKDTLKMVRSAEQKGRVCVTAVQAFKEHNISCGYLMPRPGGDVYFQILLRYI